MPQNRETNKKHQKKSTKKSQGYSRSSPNGSPVLSEDLKMPFNESITELIQLEVANMMQTSNFKRDIALEMKRLELSKMGKTDTDYVRMEDLKSAVNEIISRDTIQVALESNAKLFAEAIQDLKKRLVVVEAKLEELQDRISDVEQLVHKRHNEHIKQIVQTVMKEFAQELNTSKEMSTHVHDNPPATILFHRGAQQVDGDQCPDAVGKPPDHKRISSPNQKSPSKLSDGKKRNYRKIVKEYDRQVPVVTLPSRVSTNDSNSAPQPGNQSPPQTQVSRSVSVASVSASRIARAKQQHKQRVAERQVYEINALACKKSPFSLYLNDQMSPYPAAPIAEVPTMVHQPRRHIDYAAYPRSKWTRSGNT